MGGCGKRRISIKVKGILSVNYWNCRRHWKSMDEKKWTIAKATVSSLENDNERKGH